MKLAILTLAIFVCSVLASQQQQERECSRYPHTEEYESEQRLDDSQGGCRRDREEENVSERRLFVDDEEERENEENNYEDNDNTLFTIRDIRFQEEREDEERRHANDQSQHPQSSCRQPSRKSEKRHEEADHKDDDEKFQSKQQSRDQIKRQENCNQFTNLQQEDLVSLEDELKLKIQKISLEKEVDSLVTLMKLEQQLKVVSQLLVEQEDRLRQQAEKDEKLSKPEDKQDFEESCRLKQKKRRDSTGKHDKIEQTFIIKSKYRKVSDVDDEEQEEERVSKKDNFQSKKSPKHSQKSRKIQLESRRPSSSATVRRDCINKRIEALVKEQQEREESRKEQDSRRNQNVCINRNPRIFLNKPTRSNATCKTLYSSKVRVQHPSVRRQCSTDRSDRSRSGRPSSAKRQNVKVEEIKIQQVKRR